MDGQLFSSNSVVIRRWQSEQTQFFLHTPLYIRKAIIYYNDSLNVVVGSRDQMK